MASKEHLNRIRILSLSLFVSGGCNIIMIAILGFWVLSDKPIYLESMPQRENQLVKTSSASASNADFLKRYKATAYQELKPVLYQTELVEDGYRKRDLALGVLVAFHDFDLEKAIGAPVLASQKRMLSFDEGRDKVMVYPHLSNSQFDLIYAFLKTEKWPFQAKGLFTLLKTKQEASLYEAFYLTQEFTFLEALFKGRFIAKENLVKMLIEGNWGILSAFKEKQKNFLDVSDESRQKLLLAYINEGSKLAADILLKTDFDFAAKKLSDPLVLSILRLIHQNTEESSRFLNAIAASPRGDSVKQFAISRYQEVTGKSWEPLVSRQTVSVKPAVIEKVIPFSKKSNEIEKVAITKTAPPVVKKNLLYIVQDGDSLWKIAKRFKVQIEDIRSLNMLKSDALKPGTPLKVPDRVLPGAKDGTSKAVSM